jgi:hypothetical protein
LFVADLAEDIQNELAHILIVAPHLFEERGDGTTSEKNEGFGGGIPQPDVVRRVKKFDNLTGKIGRNGKGQKKIGGFLADTPTVIPHGPENPGDRGLRIILNHGLQSLKPLLFLSRLQHFQNGLSIHHTNRPDCCLMLKFPFPAFDEGFQGGLQKILPSADFGIDPLFEELATLPDFFGEEIQCVAAAYSLLKLVLVVEGDIRNDDPCQAPCLVCRVIGALGDNLPFLGMLNF